MKNVISTTIDNAGRVVVPKRIRELAGLTPGARVAVRYREGHVELEPEPGNVRLERRGGSLVAVHEDEGSSITTEQINDTLDRIRRREE